MKFGLMKIYICSFFQFFFYVCIQLIKFGHKLSAKSSNVTKKVTYLQKLLGLWVFGRKKKRNKSQIFDLN